MNKLKKYLPQIILKLFLICLCIIMLAPFAWVISTSLRPASESFSLPPSFFPTSFVYQNYIDVFTTFPFASCIFNSLKIASIVVVSNLIVCTMAGYAFARIDFTGKNVLFLCLLAGMMIPTTAKLIPTYLVMSKLGLVGTHYCLILPAMISSLNVFFVRQFMKTIPDSYEEAAYIDGAGRFKIWWNIFIPMSKSVIIMVALLTFLHSWNDFINPLIYIRKQELMTLPLGLKTLSGATNIGSTSVVLAGVVLSLIVPTVLYIVGQKHILQGSVMSGLKS